MKAITPKTSLIQTPWEQRHPDLFKWAIAAIPVAIFAITIGLVAYFSHQSLLNFSQIHQTTLVSLGMGVGISELLWITAARSLQKRWFTKKLREQLIKKDKFIINIDGKEIELKTNPDGRISLSKDQYYLVFLFEKIQNYYFEKFYDDGMTSEKAIDSIKEAITHKDKKKPIIEQYLEIYKSIKSDLNKINPSFLKSIDNVLFLKEICLNVFFQYLEGKNEKDLELLTPKDKKKIKCQSVIAIGVFLGKFKIKIIVNKKQETRDMTTKEAQRIKNQIGNLRFSNIPRKYDKTVINIESNQIVM